MQNTRIKLEHRNEIFLKRKIFKNAQNHHTKKKKKVQPQNLHLKKTACAKFFYQNSKTVKTEPSQTLMSDYRSKIKFVSQPEKYIDRAEKILAKNSNTIIARKIRTAYSAVQDQQYE